MSPCAKSNFSHFSYGVSAIAGSPPFSFHSVAFTHQTHGKIVSFLVPLKSTNLLFPFAFSPFISSAIATSFKRYRNPPSQFVPHSLFFPFPPPIKNLCQSLVQLAEVISTSSGRSPYPPSALTRGRLAHFSEIGIYAGNSVNRTDPDCNKVEHRDRSAKSLSHFHAPTLHFAISQPSWLHFVFSNAGSRQFSLFLIYGYRTKDY